MDNLNKIIKKNNDTLKDTESLDVIDANPKKPETTMILNNGCVSNTRSEAVDINGKKKIVLVRNYKKGIKFSHTQYFPNEPRIDLSKVDFKFNSDNFYNTNTFPRGTLTIINVKDFMKSTAMHKHPIVGTDVDVESLCDLFLTLGFKIDRFDNPKKSDLITRLKKAANENYSSMSCSVVAVLTHGKEEEIFCTDKSLKIREITNIFRTKALANKPKLLLFQVSRGINNMDKVDGPVSSNMQGVSGISMNFLHLPVESDFLYAYSTSYYSCQNKELDSCFIKAVVSIFRDYAHKLDVFRLFTRVNNELSEKTSNIGDKSKDNKKQIGSITSQLRKELFLPPINGPMEPL
ncbi:caspase-3-like [Hydra vulgaris]|uniref:Caspase-3-like n=1 Tax=Hydra vulgaris TaxID=6087 RepID=A0ABM4DKR6_HYDVU